MNNRYMTMLLGTIIVMCALCMTANASECTDQCEQNYQQCVASIMPYLQECNAQCFFEQNYEYEQYMIYFNTMWNYYGCHIIPDQQVCRDLIYNYVLFIIDLDQETQQCTDSCSAQVADDFQMCDATRNTCISMCGE
jgi:hypothetical protein